MKALETMIQNMFHKDCAACTDQEVYEALLTYTKEQLAAKGYHDGKKKIYYISAEFLIGKLLSNNLINLGIYDEVAEFLKKNGKSLAEIESVEPEGFEIRRWYKMDRQQYAADVQERMHLYGQ